MAFALCEKNSIFAPNSYRMNGKTPQYSAVSML
jgi:hypothetical protein